MEEKNKLNSNSSDNKSTEQIKRGAGDLWSGIKDFFSELIDLREGLDRYGTVKRIKENKRMQGANAWTLMCSIMIASLGLDLNSPAVIIGAMLISPLMSPILGVGLAVGINDRETLWISFRHFLIAIGIALVTSTFYFFITPFGEATPEILARTKPTLLDVLVAFFGGLAGIISGTRKDISNAIPGVAIATALMPPLCVSGFGIANMLKHGFEYHDQNYLLIASNSFYLFFLNATFVALATYMIIRMLRFPYKEHATSREKRRNQIFVLIVGLVLIIPSVYILTSLLNDNRDEKSILRYVETSFAGATGHKIEKQINRDTFEVTVNIFEEISDSTKLDYLSQLRAIVPNSNLNIRTPDYLDQNDVNASIEEKVNSMLYAEKIKSTKKDTLIADLKKEITGLKDKRKLELVIPKESKILYPALREVRFYVPDTSQTFSNMPMLFLDWKDNRLHKKEERKLIEFVKYRAQLDTVQIARR